MLNAKNGTISLPNNSMDYISFGKGNDILIIIPGLGDGLKTVKGTALAFSVAYREYGENYRVYVLSRKNLLQKDYSTKDMAKDYIDAMLILGITKAKVMGISQGGMIAQYMAIDYPDIVQKLILAVTLSKQNEIVKAVINSWIKMAENKNYKALIIDTAEKSYTPKKLKKYRLLYPILGNIGKPKDFQRFIIQANACLKHSAYHELSKIKCPVLVIGGGEDKIAGKNSSFEIAEQITDSRLYIYEEFGHAAYEEANDFSGRVLAFLKEST